MKIRIIKSIMVEIEKPRLGEVWDHYYNRWDEIKVESISIVGKFANLITTDGDIIQHIPTDRFEVLK